MKRIFALFMAAVLMLILASCSSCKHSWQEADCTTPKTCTLCGETRGTALGHLWMDATCTAPKTCSVCLATEGEPLEHNFVDHVCTYCGYTEKTLSTFGFYDLDIENKFVMIKSYDFGNGGYVIADSTYEYNVHTLRDGYYESYHYHISNGYEETNKIMYSILSEDSIEITANGTVERIYDRVIINEENNAFILKLLLPSGSEDWWISYNSIDWSRNPEETEKGVKLYLKDFG